METVTGQHSRFWYSISLYGNSDRLGINVTDMPRGEDFGPGVGNFAQYGFYYNEGLLGEDNISFEAVAGTSQTTLPNTYFDSILKFHADQRSRGILIIVTADKIPERSASIYKTVLSNACLA